MSMPETRNEIPTGFDNVGRSWGLVLSVGVLATVLGIMVLAWPDATAKVVAFLIGLQFLVLGIIYVIQTFASKKADTGQRILMAIVGILGVVAGVVTIRNPGLTLGVLVILLGAFWLVQGIVDFFGSLANADTPARGWRIFGGLVSAAAGAILLFWPGISLGVFIWITGIWLIVWGLVTVFASFQLRKLA